MQHPLTIEASLSSTKRASGLFQIRKQNIFEINKIFDLSNYLSLRIITTFDGY